MFPLHAVDHYSGRPHIDLPDNPEKCKVKLAISNVLLAIQVRKKMEFYIPLSENVKMCFA